MDNINCKIFSASGNIFTLIDNRNINKNTSFFIDNAEILCTYNETQTDGVIIINNSNKYDFSMVFINPDGTTGMMCGNGGRSAIYYYINSLEKYNENDLISFSLNDTNSIYYGSFANNVTSIYFDTPNKIDKKEVEVNGIKYSGFFLNNNTPHFVIELDDVSNFNVKEIGKAIRNDAIFSPEGTNVNFYHKISSNSIHLRTYERGVEDETGACGTGAIATSISFFSEYGILGELTIIPTSKSKLYINFAEINSTKKIKLTGKVEEIIL